MTAKHTPGPWEVRFTPKPVRHFEVTIPGDRPLCIGADGGPDDVHAQDEANAKLIAAAPELADALQGIIEIGKRDLSNPKYGGYFEAARAALKKAGRLP